MTRPKPLLFVAPVALVAALAIAAVVYQPPPPPVPGDPPAPPPPSVIEVAGELAVVNVTVIDVEAGVGHPGQTVVVKGDRIAAVRPTSGCRVAEGAKVIDGTGKFLIPGLWDMHVHVVHESLWPMFLQHGVTGVRHMFGYNPFWRPSVPTDPAAPPHPRLVSANEMMDGPDTPYSFPATRNIVIAKDADGGRAGVRELRRRGNDFVKVYAKLSKAAFLAAIEEGRTLGMPVCGHLPHAVTAAEASDAGQLTIEHLGGVAFGCSPRQERWMAELRDGTPGVVATRTDRATGWRVQLKAHEDHDPARAAALFEKFRKNGTWHVPTQVVTRATSTLGDEHFPDPIAAMPKIVAGFWQRELKDGGVRLPMVGLAFTKAELAQWKSLFELDLELVRRMHRAGVPMLAGTDTPAPYVTPGTSLHDELELFVEAGMTPAEALRTATLNPARCLGREKELGTVAAGKLADLVLVSADPLLDVRNTRSVQMVTVGGRVVPR